MESDDPKEEAQNDDKWDIVILHNDSQTELAEAVRESIKAICQTLGRPYRVEIFEDLLGAGQMHTVVFDDVLENTGVIMFFRNEEFFSEPLREFDIGTALNDRITHIETRRHWTVVPLDIEKKTKVRGKPSINGSQGLIITAEGDIKERNEERKQKKIKELLDRPCSTSSSRHAAHRSPEQSIAEGREQQLRQISALMPDASDTDAARASPSDASHAASAGTFGSDSQPLPDRRITQRSGLSRHTFHNDGRECQAVTTEGGSQLFQNNFSGRPNQNRPEVHLSSAKIPPSMIDKSITAVIQMVPNFQWMTYRWMLLGCTLVSPAHTEDNVIQFLLPTILQQHLLSLLHTLRSNIRHNNSYIAYRSRKMRNEMNMNIIRSIVLLLNSSGSSSSSSSSSNNHTNFNNISVRWHTKMQ
ncbi:hypothetical protein ACOMHN_006959 [Nucella lapillus]